MAGPPSRRRPMLFVLGAVTVTAVILIAQGAASSRPRSTEAVQAYLDEVRPAIQTSTTDGSDFDDIRTNAATLGRTGVDRRLDRLAHSVNTTLTSVDGLVPPSSLRVAHAFLVAALGIRAQAVTEARPAMDTALTMSSAPDGGIGDATTALNNVGQDLELGDRAYAKFLSTLPTGVSPPGPSVWVPDATAWSPAELSAFVTSLRSASTVSPVHDLAMVAWETDPAAITVDNGAQVIPATKNMSVSMVVENVGNQTEHNVTVTAALALSDGSQQSLRDFVDLAPGQRRAITLMSMHPQAATSGTLTISVQAVPGETQIANNTLSTPVEFR